MLVRLALALAILAVAAPGVADARDWPDWLSDLSPISWVPMQPLEPWTAGSTLGLVAVAAALVLAGFGGFRRRDLAHG